MKLPTKAMLTIDLPDSCSVCPLLLSVNTAPLAECLGHAICNVEKKHPYVRHVSIEKAKQGRADFCPMQELENPKNVYNRVNLRKRQLREVEDKIRLAEERLRIIQDQIAGLDPAELVYKVYLDSLSIYKRQLDVLRNEVEALANGRTITTRLDIVKYLPQESDTDALKKAWQYVVAALIANGNAMAPFILKGRAEKRG